MTNTAPYFTVASFSVFESHVNTATSRQIIEMIDDESNPITLSASLMVAGIANALPSFISIVGDTIVSTPLLIS